MKKVTTILYTFNELNEQAQKKAIEKLSDINVMHDWWESIYDDAKNVELDLTTFDLDRNKHAKGKFMVSAIATAHEILDEHGEESNTYKLASKYRDEYNKLDAQLDETELDTDNYYDIEGKMEDLRFEFLSDLLNEYANMLQNDYDYLCSDKAIIETIEANDYTFEEDGTLNNTPPDNEQDTEYYVLHEDLNLIAIVKFDGDLHNFYKRIRTAISEHYDVKEDDVSLDLNAETIDVLADEFDANILDNGQEDLRSFGLMKQKMY